MLVVGKSIMCRPGLTGWGFRATFSPVINVKCNACGGESQFEEATAEQEKPCPLCHEVLKVTPTKSAAELSEEEQMAEYEEALKETDWGHQPC